jgi:hypothetical protein
VALKVKGVVNRTVQAEEALGGSSRLETAAVCARVVGLPDANSPPYVLPKPLLMPAGQSQAPERRHVGAQLVGD